MVCRGLEFHLGPLHSGVCVGWGVCGIEGLGFLICPICLWAIYYSYSRLADNMPGWSVGESASQLQQSCKHGLGARAAVSHKSKRGRLQLNQLGRQPEVSCTDTSALSVCEAALAVLVHAYLMVLGSSPPCGVPPREGSWVGRAAQSTAAAAGSWGSSLDVIAAKGYAQPTRMSAVCV